MKCRTARALLLPCRQVQRSEWILPLPIVRVKRVGGPSTGESSSTMVFEQKSFGEGLDLCEHCAVENLAVFGEGWNPTSQWDCHPYGSRSEP